MHPTTRELALTVATVTLLCAGCSDATSPGFWMLHGSYALRTVASAPLPVLQWEDSYARHYIVADTLVFDGRHTVDHITVTRTDSITNAYSQLDRQRYASDYRVRGDTVDFIFRCPPNAMCIAPPVAWLEPDYKLVYAFRRYPSGFWPPSVYARVK